MRKLLVPVAFIGGLVACGDVPTAPRTASELFVAPAAAREESHVPIPGKYIVRFRDSEADVAGRGRSIERLYGATVERTYSTALKGVSVQLADAAAAAVSADPSVISVEQDAAVTLSTTTQSGATWGLDRLDQRNLPLSTTYTYSGDGTGVTVYIIDTGINLTHSEYIGRAFTGIDEITLGGNAIDCNGHGSHVSGTVGGTTYGVAKKVKLVAVRVLDCTGSGSIAGAIAGIDWVTQHATLPAAANMSLGSSFSAMLNSAVASSIAAGIVYGIAAGNSTADACTESPGSTPTAITVGATTITDAFASFSNFGSCVHISAPGVGITSAWIGSNTATNTISGTSMATPHVVGAAALYLQSNPAATPAQVRAALTSNATPGIITGALNGTPNLLLYTGFMTGPSAPVANFTASCTLLVCSFNASSSVAAPSATYAWTFGDATAGTGKTPSHTYAAAGTYSVALTVTDPNGSNSKTATVSPTNGAVNQPPTATITLPANNATFTAGASISFAGTGTDPESGALTGLALVWSSSINGQIGTGASFNTNALSVGTHTITLTATDPLGATGTSTRTLTIAVAGPNKPPVAVWTLPAPDSSFPAGQPVTFVGGGTDPEDGTLTGASIVWSTLAAGTIGTGTTFSTTVLPVGSFRVYLTVTDSKGLSALTYRTVTIRPSSNQSPVATLTAPTNGSSVVQGTSVSFAGSAADPEDGALTGASLVWTSSRDGAIGTGTSFAKINLSVGTHTITLTATDSQGATGTATVSITVTAPNQPPTAAISAPANNTSVGQGTNVAFSGTGSDPEDGVLSGASLVWTSSINGQIGTGVSFSTSALSIGSHTITLTATDSKGATGTAIVSITVTAPNQPPTAAISAPANNTSVLQGTNVAFSGTGSDPEDGVLSGASLVWTSSINGQIGTGVSFSTSTLSVGTHTITLTATDSKGATGSTTRTLIVTAPNQAPTAVISAPANGGSFAVGSSVAFAGTGSDPEDGVLSGASLVWTSSINGQIGTGVSFSTSTMSVGTHTITLTATDSKGATGTATRTVTITTGGVNLPPVPSITGPANGSTFVRGTSIAFAGTGTDPEDGALSGLSLTWRSSLGGFFGTGTSFSFSALPVGTHTITLKATDSQGATATTTRTLTITPAAGTNQAPVPVWSLPVPDTNFLLGQTVTFVGGGTDAEDGALSGASVVWSTGAIGVIGTGTTVSTNALPVGSHVVILTVTDSAGLSSYTFRTVKIQ